MFARSAGGSPFFGLKVTTVKVYSDCKKFQPATSAIVSIIDPNATRLDRASLDQRSHQLLVELSHSLFTESLVEFDQGSRVRHRIHQLQMAKVAPGESLADFPLHLFIAQPPAKLSDTSSEDRSLAGVPGRPKLSSKTSSNGLSSLD